MICFPNAKINLGLNIVSKREDGYHNIETIFYPIAIKDALEIIPSTNNKDSFNESGIKIDSVPENNLVIKALNLLRKDYKISPIDIFFLKKIPFGAGIGGGSADASFMLKLLNETFCLNIQNEELTNYAKQLGADCSFFIYNEPLFASGIGEIFENVKVNLKKYFIVLVKPDIHISTKDAFSFVKPAKPNISLKDIIQKPIEEWKHLMFNDFEKSVFQLHPQIKEIKNTLYKSGAIYASMSGSGSSVYGIFAEKQIGFETIFKDCFIWQGEGM